MMRFEYIIYPEAREKLESHGIIDKIKKANKKGYIGISGYIFEDYVPKCLREMQKQKLLDSIPEEERKEFMTKLEKAWKNRDVEGKGWVVRRKSGDCEEGVEHVDFLAMAGYNSSCVLKKEELFAWRKFGFSSLTDFTGSVEAAISSVIHDNSNVFHPGYKWESKSLDGRVLFNEISGDMNCDMRIFQIDKTPYETIDPIGNKVSYRPEFDKDRNVVAAYHSTEGSLLAAVLKWAKQFDLPSEALKDGAKEVISWAKSIRGGGATCAEHFGGINDSPRIYFACFDYSLTCLNELDCSYKPSGECIGTMGDGFYGVYARENTKELVLAYENRAGRDLKAQKIISVAFQPSDVDHLVKGLLYQSAKLQGRTSLGLLTDMLEYRFSPQLERDLEEMRRK